VRRIAVVRRERPHTAAVDSHHPDFSGAIRLHAVVMTVNATVRPSGDTIGSDQPPFFVTSGRMVPRFTSTA